jgi:hypothetical protein
MVGEDGERFFGPDQIGSPVGYSFHDCQKFLFVDVIITFGFGESGGVVSEWVQPGFSSGVLIGDSSFL